MWPRQKADLIPTIGHYKGQLTKVQDKKNRIAKKKGDNRSGDTVKNFTHSYLGIFRE